VGDLSVLLRNASYVKLPACNTWLCTWRESCSARSLFECCYTDRCNKSNSRWR